MKTDPYYNRLIAQRISSDADQTEFAALRNGTARVQIGVRDDILADAMDDFELNDGVEEEDWQAAENHLDQASTRLLDELSARATYLGELYPFVLEGDVLRHVPKNDLIYEFLLCTSVSPSLTSGEFRHLPRTFERVAATLSATFLGHDVGFQHIGWPRTPPRFKAAMKQIQDATREWVWRPEPDLPDEGPRSGDEGVDYVVWKDFGCGRQIGQLFFLGQCACGNDWNTKFDDINIQKFGKWFAGRGSLVTPTKFFSVPYVIVEPVLREASREAGIVMDRIRLTKTSTRNLHYVSADWQGHFSKLINVVLAA